MKVKRYEELVAWQRAMELTKRVYALQKRKFNGNVRMK